MPTKARKAPAKRKGGRPAFKPTDEQRRTVATMVAGGIKQDAICLVLGISKPTLEKHFRSEIDNGAQIINARVVCTLANLALGKPAEYDENRNLIRAEVPPDKGAAIYWTKTRMGWKEKDRLELTGADGGPIEHSAVNIYLPDNGRDPSPEGTAGSVPRDTG